MANTIALAFGQDNTRLKETHRLGSVSSTAQANTWRTITTCHVNADGSGYVEVIRNKTILHSYQFGPEE